MLSYKEFVNINNPFQEMARGHGNSQQWQLSEPAMWLLNMMGNNQRAALYWLLNKGLYEATAKRKELADKATIDLNRQNNPVDDHALFSQAAHAKDSDLNKYYQDVVVPAWNEYEKNIIIPIGKGISLAKVNQELKGQGVPEFTFGGYDGFIEWLEDGDWADKYADDSMFKNAWDNRKGLDLSNPSHVKDPSTDTEYYVFGSNESPGGKFYPSENPGSYDQALKDTKRLSGNEIESLPSSQDQSSLGKKSYDWLSKYKDSDLTKNVDYKLGVRERGGMSGGEAEVKIPDDEWGTITQAIKDGIDIYNNQKENHFQKPKDKLGIWDEIIKPWTDQEKKDIYNQIVDEKDRTVKDRAYDPINFRVVSALANAHGKKPGAPGYNHRVVRHPSTFLDLGLSKLEKENKDFKRGQLKSLTNINYSFKGTPVLVKSSNLKGHHGYYTPILDSEKSANFQKNWFDNPQSYGDQPVRDRYIGGGGTYPSSLIQAVKNSIGKATKMGVPREEAQRIVGNEDFISDALMAMSRYFGGWPFKYGDPLSKWTKFSDKLEDNHGKNIYTLFSNIGVPQDVANDYINKLYAYQKQNKPLDFPKEVMDVFLQNGFNWRVNYASNGVAEEIRNRFDQSRKERAGSSATGKGGDEIDPLQNVGDRESGASQIRDLYANGEEAEIRKGRVRKIGDASIQQIKPLAAQLGVTTPTGNTVPSSSDTNSNELSGSLFKNFTASDHPDIAKDPNYNEKYRKAGFRFKLIAPIQSDDFNRDISRNANELLKGITNTSQARGVLDALGDKLNTTIHDLTVNLSDPSHNQKVAPLVAGIMSQLLNKKSSNGIMAFATKANAGDYSKPIDMIKQYYDGLDIGFKDEVKKSYLDMMAKQKELTQTPAIPTTGQTQPATGGVGVSTQQPQPAPQTSYYSGDDDDAPLPLPTMSAPQQTALTSRNPLAARRMPLPNTKAEQVNGMTTFKEWVNWKTVKALKNGS